VRKLSVSLILNCGNLDVLLQTKERDHVNRNHPHIGGSGAFPQRTHGRCRFEPSPLLEPQNAVGGTEPDEAVLFETVRRLLRPSGRFLILDSAWTELRAKFNQKVERQARNLNDGTPFEIYKRYFDRQDISGWEKKYNVVMPIEHFGTAFFVVSGNFRGKATAESV
jgi:hypothetical protein